MERSLRPTQDSTTYVVFIYVLESAKIDFVDARLGAFRLAGLFLNFIHFYNKRNPALSAALSFFRKKETSSEASSCSLRVGVTTTAERARVEVFSKRRARLKATYYIK